ncbi:hypothetical protein BST93_07075 [Nonlabens tegetincola]|nr:hypothetical protein BST93_07075 [Nonlabens tegetincola]
MHKLRDVIKGRKFERQQDIIDFFKLEKPFIYGRLKFHVKLYKYVSLLNSSFYSWNFYFLTLTKQKSQTQESVNLHVVANHYYYL